MFLQIDVAAQYFEDTFSKLVEFSGTFQTAKPLMTWLNSLYIEHNSGDIGLSQLCERSEVLPAWELNKTAADLLGVNVS